MKAQHTPGISAYRTERDGRAYEVVVNPGNRSEPFHQYCSVYRVRKNGDRGMQLMSHRPEAWAVWLTIRDQVLRDEGQRG